MTTTLRLVFKDDNDATINMRFANANATADPADVKSLTQAIISNADVYAEQPATVIGAEFIVNTTLPVDLS